MEIKTMFKMSFGPYCGLFLDKKTMKKMTKLLYRQNQEIKDLLNESKENLIVSNWTLAYPNGIQENVNYGICSEWETVEGRINLIDKTINISKVKVYMATRDEAIEEHMKLYDDTTELGER